ICVMGLVRPDEPTTERLHAVVYPDPDLLRERRIVNAGDLLRFEMEGVAVDLPPHKRVLSFDVWFEPLPKTTTGKLKRREVLGRGMEKQAEAAQTSASPLSSDDEAWMSDPVRARAIEIIRGKTPAATRLVPDANLELDLGLDSMERVEL